jgi:hypothetical protein
LEAPCSRRRNALAGIPAIEKSREFICRSKFFPNISLVESGNIKGLEAKKGKSPLFQNQHHPSLRAEGEAIHADGMRNRRRHRMKSLVALLFGIAVSVRCKDCGVQKMF